jgi:soluble lytic murein transglycosylase
MRGRVKFWLFASAVIALSTAAAVGAPSHKHVPAQASKTPKAEHKGGSVPEVKHRAAKGQSEPKSATHAVPLPIPRPAAANTATVLPPDLAATKQAIELVRQRKLDEATALAASIGDPPAQKLIEWALLRSSDSATRFGRYAAFIRDNPDWPSIPLLRRRAEERLWQTRADAATVRGFFDGEPTSAVGRLALARVLTGEGDRAGAEREIRTVWRSAKLSAELEAAVLDAFRDQLTRADHLARMDKRIGAKDFGAAMRAAKRLGDNEVAIVKGCAAAEATSGKASDRTRPRTKTRPRTRLRPRTRPRTRLTCLSPSIFA